MFAEIGPDEVAEWRARGAGVVDVREPWEFEAGHVPGAVNIPMGELVARKSEVSDPVVLVCQTGARSGRVAAYLMANGHGAAANLVGGTQRWIREGNEVE